MTPNEITPSRSNPTEAATATATAERGAPSTKVTGSAQATVNPKKRKRYATVFDAVAGRVASSRFLPAEPSTSRTRDTLTSTTVAVSPDHVLARRRKHALSSTAPTSTTTSRTSKKSPKSRHEDHATSIPTENEKDVTSTSTETSTEDEEEEGDHATNERIAPNPRLSSIPAATHSPPPDLPPPPAPAQDLPNSDLLRSLHAYASDFYSRATKSHGAAGDWHSMDETALLALGILLEEAATQSLGETGDLAFVEGQVEDD